MPDSIAVAELAIYAVLTIPVLYNVVRHGKPGLLGWLYLLVFCSLRIVGGGLAFSADNGSTASIISSIGLSPLLFATSGLLHEARLYRKPSLDPKFEWVLVLFFHVLVAAGVGLLAVGVSDLEGGTPQPSDLTYVEVGMAILTACWAILVLAAVVSTLAFQQDHHAPSHSSGTTLLYGVLFGLLVLGIRVFYTLVALVTEKPYLSPTTGTMPIRVLLSLLPELIVVLAYVVVGVLT